MSSFSIKSLVVAQPGYVVTIEDGVRDADVEMTRIDEQLIAWAVVTDNETGHDSIEPVFLDEYNVPVVFSQWEQDQKAQNKKADPSYEVHAPDEIDI